MVPAGLSRAARADWRTLAQPVTDAEIFDATQPTGLPVPVQRWLTHAITAGTRLTTTVQVVMRGEIRLGAWRPFTAVQRLTLPGGFVWSGTARISGLPVSGFDRYTRATGEMRWRLLNVIPVMHSDGPDITRSAAGRHAGELLLYTPAAALDPTIQWREESDHRATATFHVDTWPHEVTLTIDPEGKLTELAMHRWGNPDGDSFGEHIFGARFDGDLNADGFTLPAHVTAGWHYGSDRWPRGQFIRYTILDVTYR